MNKLFLALPLAALLLPAQTTPTKIGIIQMQSALALTKDGQAALDELDKKVVTPKRKEIEAKQAEVKELQDKLTRGGNTMAQAAKDDLQRQIDQKTKNLNRDMEDAQAELEGEQQKIVQGLVEKLQPIIEKYANDNGYALIIDVSNPNSGVTFAAAGTEVTKAIVELYDKTAPAAAKPAAAKPAGGAPPQATPVKPPPAAPKVPPVK